MDCLICRDMERAVESRHAEYAEARFTAYYRFSTKLAARRMVELERAKNELLEHKLICAVTPRESTRLPKQDLMAIP